MPSEIVIIICLWLYDRTYYNIVAEIGLLPAFVK